MKYSYLKRILLLLAVVAAVGDLSFGQVVAPRQERRIERQEQRLNNRIPYYNPQSWSQLNPWITRNQVPAATRAALAANAAVNTAVNATAAANAAARYGYSTPNNVGNQPAWFYDYYTYSPTYYSAPAANATAYGNAIRYQDTNGDGIYDSVANFRDSSNSGKFDVYDRYDFTESENNNDKNRDKDNDGFPDSLVDSKRHTVSGKIESTKIAKVNGVESLIVGLTSSTSNANNPAAVDLGATTQWQSRPVKEGDTLTASGPFEQIGDKQVMIADVATVGQSKQVMITRLSPSLEGQVVDVTQTEVKGIEHTLVIVDNGSNRQIVDLGPSAALKFKIKPQTKLTVRGIPVQVRDHNIVMAEVVDLNGQQITIQRW